MQHLLNLPHLMMKNLLTITAVLIASSAASITPYSASVKKHEAQRIDVIQRDIDSNIRKFKENLEGLKTTVDFEPITI